MPEPAGRGRPRDRAAHAAVLTAACDLPAARDKRLDGDNDLLGDRRPALYG